MSSVLQQEYFTTADPASLPTMPMYAEFLRSTADVVLVVEGTELPWHSQVLASESQGFKDMLESISRVKGALWLGAAIQTCARDWTIARLSNISSSHVRLSGVLCWLHFCCSALPWTHGQSAAAGKMIRVEGPFNDTSLGDMQLFMKTLYRSNASLSPRSDCNADVLQGCHYILKCIPSCAGAVTRHISR